MESAYKGTLNAFQASLLCHPTATTRHLGWLVPIIATRELSEASGSRNPAIQRVSEHSHWKDCVPRESIPVPARMAEPLLQQEEP